MKFPLRLSLVLSATVAMFFTALVPANAQTNGLRVLFLGDRAGHRPVERFNIIKPVFATKNIDVTYTESMLDINSTNLAMYDCLLIYANTTRITPDQEKAMMDFVAAGAGIAPIHCSSFAFQNSTNYISLVGGQFQRHGTGVFKETIVNSEHPVMKGLSAIESWDESYVHTKHNTNRVVLAERRDDSGAEPYTWVRDHGKGRVFYTAWGHDARTWTNANFQALLENGVRWSAENSPNLAQRRAAGK